MIDKAFARKVFQTPANEFMRRITETQQRKLDEVVEFVKSFELKSGSEYLAELYAKRLKRNIKLGRNVPSGLVETIESFKVSQFSSIQVIIAATAHEEIAIYVSEDEKMTGWTVSPRKDKAHEGNEQDRQR